MASGEGTEDAAKMNPLQLIVLARDYSREMQLPPPAQWVLGPMAVVLATLARALGYRGRYDRYSGPRDTSTATTS